MKIHINGNINEYYIQTLSMLFFPGVKFSENAEDELSADVVITETAQGVCSSVTLKNGDATAEHTHIEPRGNGTEKVSTERISCGKAFLEAGKKLPGIIPSWGILTGVRPAKLAISDIRDGIDQVTVRNSLVK